MTSDLAAPALLPEPVFRRSLEEDDFEALRSLLVDTVRLVPPGLNWDMRRLDGQRFHNSKACLDPSFLHQAAVWTTAVGRIVAAVHASSEGEASIQIHPDFRRLEPEIVRYACSHLAAEREGELVSCPLNSIS